MLFQEVCHYCQGTFEYESNGPTYLERLGDGIERDLFVVVGDESADFFPLHHECHRKHYRPGDRLYEWIKTVVPNDLKGQPMTSPYWMWQNGEWLKVDHATLRR